MAIAVDIFVSDTSITPQPIADVIANIYDATTLAFIATGTSDATGDVALLLPGSPTGISYEVRLFKSGVLFSNPVQISVEEPLSGNATNNFDVSGTLLTLPTAVDPRMCRCTGQFIDFSGTGIYNALVRFNAILGSGQLPQQPDSNPLLPQWLTLPPPSPPNILSGFQVPKVLDGKMVSSEAFEVHTDINGKVSVDLIRNGQYYVTFAGEDDTGWPIVVPDRSSVNLIDLIHPAPVSLTWDATAAPGNAVSVAVGATTQIPFTVLFSNYFTYAAGLTAILLFTNSNGTVVEVDYDGDGGQLVLTGLVAGTAQVTVSIQANMTPSRIPNYSITYTPLSITVT